MAKSNKGSQKSVTKSEGPEDILVSEETANAPETNHSSSKKKDMAKSGPNDALDLTSFNYKELVGDDYTRYQQLIASLRLNDNYDFELYKTVPVLKPRYEGVPGTPIDMIGLRLKNDTPEFTTRIPVSVALDHNAQIENAHSRAGHGKYYFLKK